MYKPLSQMIEEIEPNVAPYIPLTCVKINKTDYDRMKRVAIELAKALDDAENANREAINGIFRGFIQAAKGDLIESQLNIKKALSRAKDIIGGG